MIAEWKLENSHICLFRESEALAFSSQGRNGARTRFKPLIYNIDYAANLVSLFYKTIEANLKSDEPSPSSFIPLLLDEPNNNLKTQIALFGRITSTADQATAELKGLHWGIHHSTLGHEHTLDVQDGCTREYIRWAPHVNFPQNNPLISQKTSEQYNQKFALRLTLQAEAHPNGHIQQIALRYQRNWYEVNGRTCSQALAAYLVDLNPDSLQTLRQIGLAPTQITAEQCTDVEWGYFKALNQQMDAYPKNEQERIFAHLEAYYPTIFPTLLEEIVQRLDAQPVDNSYALILDSLKQQVVGQDYAVAQLATALKAQNEADDKSRVFLSVGPSGVGKTELSKAVAKLKQERYVRFDMDQFKGQVDFYKLFGSTSGYVGSTDRPLFAKELDPYVSSSAKKDALLEKTITHTVILFDEFEKAHAEVKQTLLTLFDEGYCKVQYTKEKENIVIHYIFRKCIFMATSNLYTSYIVEKFAQGIPPATIANQFVEWNKLMPLPQSFSPELMARMKPLPFSPIPKGEVYQNLIKTKLPTLLSDLQQSVNCASVIVAEADLPEVIRLIEAKHYGDGTGIRKIKQYFQQEVETTINQQQDWGNLQDKCLNLIPLSENTLGIKCVRKVYGKTIQEYAPIEI